MPRWEDRLSEYIDSRMAEPFAWGTNDCATFAAQWVEIATGVRVFEAEHEDAHGAAREIAARGGMQAAITGVLGEPLEFALEAQRGDVGLVDIEGRVSAVVVIGALAVGPGESGLHAVSIADLTCAWRV